MSIYTEKQLIYVYSVTVSWMQPLASSNHTKTPWCVYKCFARGVKYPSFPARMLSTLACHEDGTPHSLRLDIFRHLLSIGFFHNQAATLPCSCVCQFRQDGTTDGRGCEDRSLLLQADTTDNFFRCLQGIKTCKQLVIFYACVFLNFGGNCLVFEFSVRFSISDHWH